jgi:hypothetical protein
VKWTWFGWIVLFFAWIFVVHGVAILLHEIGGHALAVIIVGCKIDRIKLSYFGWGGVWPAPCTAWTQTRHVIFDWAGLAITLPVGPVAMAFQRRAGLTPPTRLLLALFATRFLLSDLAYATSGGYYEVGDPQLTAVLLESHGLHVLAWLPPLVLFAASALYGARVVVDAFRVHFGSRTRLETLKQVAATLGVAGLLSYSAFRIESAIGTDMFRGIAFAAGQRAAFFHQAPPFPIHYVLLAIAVAATVIALARPVRRREGAPAAAPGRIPRRHAVGVAAAALGCVIAITVLGRVGRTTPAEPVLVAPPPPASVMAPKGLPHPGAHPVQVEVSCTGRRGAFSGVPSTTSTRARTSPTTRRSPTTSTRWRLGRLRA